jgi:hypothetical protein
MEHEECAIWFVAPQAQAQCRIEPPIDRCDLK